MKFNRIILILLLTTFVVSGSVTIQTGAKIYLNSGELSYSGNWTCSGLFYPGANSIITTVQSTGTGAFTNNAMGISISANLNNNIGNISTYTKWTAVSANGNTGIGCQWHISSDYAPSGRDLTLSWNTLYDNGLTGSVCVYKSSDGGQTWQAVTTPVTISSLGSPIRSITISGVSSFSDWTVGGTGDQSLPVELAYFNGTYENGCVMLNWRTESEIDNLGFLIERCGYTSQDSTSSAGFWKEIASYCSHEMLKGQGSSSGVTNYGFVDRQVESDHIYEYRLSEVSYEAHATVIASIKISINDEQFDQQNIVPAAYKLENASPNPFNLNTVFSYQLPDEVHVLLEIFDMNGRLIDIVVDQKQEPGNYSVSWAPQNIGSGLYIVKMKAGNKTCFSKCTFLK